MVKVAGSYLQTLCFVRFVSHNREITLSYFLKTLADFWASRQSRSFSRRCYKHTVSPRSGTSCGSSARRSCRTFFPQMLQTSLFPSRSRCSRLLVVFGEDARSYRGSPRVLSPWKRLYCCKRSTDRVRLKLKGRSKRKLISEKIQGQSNTSYKQTNKQNNCAVSQTLISSRLQDMILFSLCPLAVIHVLIIDKGCRGLWVRTRRQQRWTRRLHHRQIEIEFQLELPLSG